MDSLSHPWSAAEEAGPLFSPAAHDALAPASHHVWRRWAAPVFVASGGLLSATTAMALYVVERLTRASAAVNTYGFSPFEIGVPWENVRIPTADDETLSGWWLTRAETKRVVICCHGYRGHKADLLGVGAGLWRQGFNAVLFDYRGHGEHVGTRITLGYREVADALAAVNYVHERMPEAQIGIIGYSMGAAVAIMAAARDPRIQAVVADSPFAAQRNPIKLRMKQSLHAPWSGDPILFLADRLLRWRAGFSFRDVEPLREIAYIAPRPLLIIHGIEDRVIDHTDSRMLFEAAGEPKELWLLPEVGHCGAYFLDRPAYVERISRFFAEALATELAPPEPAGQMLQQPAY